MLKSWLSAPVKSAPAWPSWPGSRKSPTNSGPRFRTLRVEYTDVETRAQAAIVAGDEPKPTETSTEARQLAELIVGASIGQIFGAALEHRADGRAGRASSKTELGLSRQPNPAWYYSETPKHRATGVTPAPGDVGATQGEIIPAVFPHERAPRFLGVDTPTVAWARRFSRS